MTLHRSRGFTLIELSVALLALGLVLLGATMVWQQQTRVRVATVQQDAQAQARQALMGFLYLQHRLPCPAANAEGVEACSDGAGALASVGFFPWRTVGLPRPEAGRLRYGVYREPAPAAGTPAVDRDFAVARDRMSVLRVRTPTPRPQNADAPNSQAPPVPVAAAGLLGATRSGDAASPLNATCNAANAPPCPSTAPASVGLVDMCLALNTASSLGAAPAGQLAVQMGSVRRAVAFVIAVPGLLDSDGDGQAFDGPNASASSANPTFASASAPATDTYDDKVLSASHAELFTELQCATGLAAAVHAHSHAAIGAFTLERGLYDYRDQLYIKVKLADADVYAAAAGISGAFAGNLDAIQAVASAVADTTLSVGARSFQIGLAAVGLAASVVGTASAIAAQIDAATSLVEAKEVHADFASRTSAATDLSISVNRNVLTADAIGF